jgi:hypothetical protein
MTAEAKESLGERILAAARQIAPEYPRTLIFLCVMGALTFLTTLGTFVLLVLGSGG